MPITIAYSCNHRWQVCITPDRYTGMVSIAGPCPDCKPRHLVTAPNMDGEHIATGRMEGELNGWRYTRE